MRHIYTLAICLILSFTASAQTKLIAHKSHSGSIENFNRAYSNSLFDIQNSNFGEAPRRFLLNVCLDSVEHVSDSVAIMFTSHCTTQGVTSPQQNWKPGADTVKHHHLFSGDYSLQKIKYELEYNYNFDNDIETVKFIGFEGFREKENSVIPVIPTQKNNLPLLLLVGLIFVSAFAGWVSHRNQVRGLS